MTSILPSSANGSRSDLSVTLGSKKQSVLNSRIMYLTEKEISKPGHARKNTYAPAVPSTHVVPSPIIQDSVLKIKPHKSKLTIKMNKLLRKLCKTVSSKVLKHFRKRTKTSLQPIVFQDGTPASSSKVSSQITQRKTHLVK